MHHFVTEMCTFLLQNGALWDMGLVYCVICAKCLISIDPARRAPDEVSLWLGSDRMIITNGAAVICGARTTDNYDPNAVVKIILTLVLLCIIFWENFTVYLQFLSFLNTDVAKVIETLPLVGPKGPFILRIHSMGA